MVLTEEQKICPICGKPNNCMHGQGKCWCEEVVVPKHIIEMVPKEKRGKACICKSCIDKYSNI